MTYGFDGSELEEAVRWRHDLHRNPELGFEELRTCAFVAALLAEWGFRVETGCAGTGVVGTLRKGTSPRSIGIRAEMDALPIEEGTGAPYASITPNVMHACGHDGHMAMALLAARTVSRTPFDGTVHFIFQPAEENEGGARAMIQGGLFRSRNVDKVFALHNWPALPLGSLVARSDRMMAALGTFEIAIEGKGSHGAMPHEGADPVIAASQLVGALQTISSRNVSPLEASVVSVTQIHGGDAWNVIPERVILKGTTRWFEDAVGDLIEERMGQLPRTLAAGLGCEARIDYVRRYPATINDAACAAAVRALADRDPRLTVVDALPSMAAEDFAFMLREKPGCYFWLGSARDGASNPGLHSPRFDFNDALLPIGAGFWVGLVRSMLSD